jgi:cold-inducible RNA-binding protein
MKKLFVGNLSFGTTREELEAVFSPMGEMTEVSLPTERETGRPRGFAFVTYANDASAAEAVAKLDGTELGGRTVRVSEATERPSRFQGGGGEHRGRPFRAKGSRRNIRGRKRSL